MGNRLNPYLSFAGNARDAAEFYHDVFGGQLDVNTFGDVGGAPEGVAPEGVMHAQLVTDGGFTLMLADGVGPSGPPTQGDAFSVSLSGDEADDLRAYWEKLSLQGTVTVSLEKQMWGDEFGMLIDRFGVHWMVNIVGDHG